MKIDYRKNLKLNKIKTARKDIKSKKEMECCIISKIILQKVKKIFIFAAANWKVANWDDHTEMVKTKKLMLQFAENDKCAYYLNIFE